MDYQKIYNQLIERGQRRDILEGYIEEHHIIPKCVGGNDDQENLVLLTAREHFIAHILLAKIHGGALWHAAHMMSNMGRYTNRKYEIIRKEHAKLVGDFMRGRKKPAGHGKKISENKERARKISVALTGRKRSDEHSRNIGLGNKGKIVSDDAKHKISVAMSGKNNPMYGKTHNDESRRIISEANKQKIVCPHCNKEGGIAIMKRWHFDKCKNKVP